MLLVLIPPKWRMAFEKTRLVKLEPLTTLLIRVVDRDLLAFLHRFQVQRGAPMKTRFEITGGVEKHPPTTHMTDQNG